MTCFKSVSIALAVSSLMTLGVHAQTTDKPFPVVKPDDIAWKDAGKGVKFAVISGDPSKPGPYVIRVYFPPGIMSAPHYHREDRYVTVNHRLPIERKAEA